MRPSEDRKAVSSTLEFDSIWITSVCRRCRPGRETGWIGGAPGRGKQDRRAPVVIRRRKLFCGLGRILDGLVGLELHVLQLACHPLDPADVDVLHEVAGLR